MDQNQDEQYLKLLSIFHYVVGGLAGLFACFPIIHLVVGIGVLISSLTGSYDGPGALFGLFFIVIAGSIMLVGWTFAICIMLTGRFIATRKHYMFCLVMACIECMFSPFGTVLGVFTIIVLIRPSVKASFEGQTVGSLPQAA
jgi:hypothetical protein